MSDNLTRSRQSRLFTAFNLARHSGQFDRRRVNRALGYVQAGRVALLPDNTAVVEGESEPVYYVNGEGCDCPDHLWRGSTCKHMLARWIALKVEVLAGPLPYPEPPAPPAPPIPAAPVGEPALAADIALLWG